MHMMRAGMRHGAAALVPWAAILPARVGGGGAAPALRGAAGGAAFSAQTGQDVGDQAAAAGPSEAEQAARELGLDAMPLPKLREMLAGALPRADRESALTVPAAPAKQKRLTYADVEGYKELLESMALLPETYAHDIPRAPALDAGQWVDAHFKQDGYGLEPRSGFYSWRAWAAAALPREQAETLVATAEAMGDDNTRSELLKQAQLELARLWDWQRRRARLGLSPDLPPASAAAAASSPAAEDSSAAAEPEGPGQGASAQEGSEAAEAAPALDAAPADAADAAAADADGGQQPAKEGIWKALDEVLADAAAKAQRPEPQAKAEAAAALVSVDDVLKPGGGQPSPDKEGQVLIRSRQRTLDVLQAKLARGAKSAERGRYRTGLGAPLRTYQPTANDDDLFLPTKALGSAKVAAALSDPARARPVDPELVTRQAVATAENAVRSGAAGAATWASMPLLDRAVLHRQTLRDAQERLAAKPKRKLPWRPPPPGEYGFDLRVRPPTPALDLVTAYLEAKYADVLMRQDAVSTLQRQMALDRLASRGGAAATEAAERSPAALTAAATLSPAERQALTDALDGLLAGGQYGQYTEAALQLYCDGLVTWGELQQCWAAADAAQELEAAESAPVGIADDRQRLFGILSGNQQLGSLAGGGTSAAAEGAAPARAPPTADEEAARRLWDAAGEKLAGGWAAAARQAHGGAGAAWAQPVAFDEAQRTWQQLLRLAGQPDGPRLEQVLLAGDQPDTQLALRLQQLQDGLERATGLAVGAAGVALDDFEGLKQMTAAPPSVEELMRQHWQQVAREELGEELSLRGPSWQQLWQLLQRLTQRRARGERWEGAGDAPAAAAAGAAAGSDGIDLASLFDRYLREAEAVPLTPPPYPGASRLLRWEQRFFLGAASGRTAMPGEVKARLTVHAAELQQEVGLSDHGLRYLLAVAGSRYDPGTELLTLTCDRFPTREENRRWCLEVLHRLLHEAQAAHPTERFLLGPGTAAAAAAAATTLLP